MHFGSIASPTFNFYDLKYVNFFTLSTRCVKQRSFTAQQQIQNKILKLTEDKKSIATPHKFELYFIILYTSSIIQKKKRGL